MFVQLTAVEVTLILMKLHDRPHSPGVPILQQLLSLFLENKLVLDDFGGRSVKALDRLGLDGCIGHYSPAFISLLE